MYTVYTVLLDTFSPAVHVNNTKKKMYGMLVIIGSGWILSK